MWTSLWRTCGWLVDYSNAPHRICANSHTHKTDLKKLSSTSNEVEGVQPPPWAVLGDGSRKFMNGLHESQGRPQGGPWWTAVDQFIDRQYESQLLNENERTQEPSKQLLMSFPSHDPNQT